MKKKTIFLVVVKIFILIIIALWSVFSPYELFAEYVIGFSIFVLISLLFKFR